MANSIDDISDNTLVPTGAHSTIDSDGADWGVDGAFTDSGLTGLIIQNETYQDQPQIDQTFDQKNRLVHELTYDHIKTITLDVIGLGSDATPTALQPNSIVHYKPSGASAALLMVVRNCNYAGAYNDKKKWSVTLEQRAQWPTNT